MTKVQDIERWLEQGEKDGHRWLIVVCDRFSYEDYPVYADTPAEFYEEYDAHNGKNMQAVVESYDIAADWKPQLCNHRNHSKP